MDNTEKSAEKQADDLKVPMKPAEKPRIEKRQLMVAVMLFLSTAMGFLGGWLGAEGRLKSGDLSQATEQKIISSESNLISGIAKKVGESVVSVNVSSEVRQESIFGPRSVEQTSAGTGFVIDKNIIVTNRHVVPARASGISITLADGVELTDVELIGRTNQNDPLDVAFLKVNDTKGRTLQPVTLGDSSNMQVGDKVVAIGNALGQFQNTVTSGIISGFARDVDAQGANGTESLQNLFQTDAAINQGNSGGPLVNMKGEVIGINTAVATDSENIGFAIPINDIAGLIRGVVENGKLERPYLGVRYASITDDYAYQYNLPFKRGAYIIPSANGQPSILPDSPAEKAGIKEKDIITKVNDTTIDENNNLSSVLGRSSVGDTVRLTILRDGQEQVIEAKLEALPTD